MSVEFKTVDNTKVIVLTIPAVFTAEIRAIKDTKDWSALPAEVIEKAFDYGRQRLMNDSAGRHVGKKDAYQKGGKVDESAYKAAVDAAIAKTWAALLEGDTGAAAIADRSLGAAIRNTALDFFAKTGRATKEDKLAIRKNPETFFRAWAEPVAKAKAIETKRPESDVPAMVQKAWDKMIGEPAAALFATWAEAAKNVEAVATMFD